MDTIWQVMEFHEKAGHFAPSIPLVNNHEINLFRGKLMLEELAEYFGATGHFGLEKHLKWIAAEHSLSMRMNEPKLIDIFDSLLDMQYVLDGTFIQQGFAPFKGAGFEEVHRSNMSKDFPKEPKYIAHKITKGANYSPPNLKAILTFNQP